MHCSSVGKRGSVCLVEMNDKGRLLNNGNGFGVCWASSLVKLQKWFVALVCSSRKSISSWFLSLSFEEESVPFLVFCSEFWGRECFFSVFCSMFWLRKRSCLLSFWAWVLRKKVASSQFSILSFDWEIEYWQREAATQQTNMEFCCALLS